MNILDELLAQVGINRATPEQGGRALNPVVQEEANPLALVLANLQQAAYDQVGRMPPMLAKGGTNAPTQRPANYDDTAAKLALTNLITASQQQPADMAVLKGKPVQNKRSGNVASSIDNAQSDLADVNSKLTAQNTINDNLAAELEDLKNQLPKPLTENEKKAAYINERSAAGDYGTSGGKVTASVQPNGVVSITNTDPTKVWEGTPKAEGGLVNGEMTASSVQQALTDIYNEPDEKTRIDLLTKLQATYAQYLTQKSNSAKTIAENKYGIPKMREELAVRLQKDSDDRERNPELRGKENPVTTRMERELATAITQANNEADNAVKSNVALVGIDSMVKAAIPMLNKADTRRQNEERAATTLQEKIELKKDVLLSTTDPVHISNYKKLNPEETKGMSDADIATRMSASTKGNTGQDAADLVSAYQTKEDFVKSALVSKNKHTKRLAIIEEATMSGAKPEQLDAEFAEAEKMMNNGQYLNSQVAKHVRGITPEQREEMAKAGNSDDLTGNKDKQRAAREQKYEVVQKVLSAKKTAEFTNDVSTWDNYTVDSKMGQAIADFKVLHPNQTPNSKDILAILIGNKTTKAERMPIINYFNQEATKAANRKNIGSFGSIAITEVINNSKGALDTKGVASGLPDLLKGADPIHKGIMATTLALGSMYGNPTPVIDSFGSFLFGDTASKEEVEALSK